MDFLPFKMFLGCALISVSLMATGLEKPNPISCVSDDGKTQVTLHPEVIAGTNLEVSQEGQVHSYQVEFQEFLELKPTRLAGATHIEASFGDGQYVSLVAMGSDIFGSAKFNLPAPDEVLLTCHPSVDTTSGDVMPAVQVVPVETDECTSNPGC